MSVLLLIFCLFCFSLIFFFTHSVPGVHNLKQTLQIVSILPLPSTTHKTDWQQWCSRSASTSLWLKVACSWPGGGDSEWSVDSVITVHGPSWTMVTVAISLTMEMFFWPVHTNLWLVFWIQNHLDFLSMNVSVRTKWNICILSLFIDVLFVVFQNYNTDYVHMKSMILFYP